MTTLTIQGNNIGFTKTNFKSIEELYDFIQDFYLKEKLEKISDELGDGPFSEKQSYEFLDNMFVSKGK